MDELQILIKVLLDYDLNQVQQAIDRLQKTVDNKKINVKLDIDQNAQSQLKAIQKQIEGFKPTTSGLLIPSSINYTPIKQGTDVFKKQGEAIKAAASTTNTYAENISRAGQQIQTADKHTRGWGASLSRIIQYYVSFQMTIGLLRQSINTLKDMDDSLTQLSKVTNITRSEFQQLGIEALEFASNYGRSVKDALDAQVTFARAGFDNYKQMAELSLVTQAAGDMNESLASSYLIASDKAYDYGGSVAKLTALLDAQNQVSNRHAISLEFLAEATKNAGNSMRLAGETEQTMTAALTAIGVATQKSGSEVGRAARTIEMRIQQVKQAFKGLETEVDGEIINAAELSNAAKALEEIGIQVIKVEDGVEKFATMTEIAVQLSAALDNGTISATEMNKVVDALAGKHRAEYFLALVNNIDEYNRALENYTNSTGSAMEEAMKQAASWEGRVNALKNAWTEFVAKSVDSEWVKALVDAVSFLIKSFDNLGTVLGIVAAAFITLKLPALIPWFQTLQLQIKLLSMEVASAGGFFNLLKMAFTGTAASAGTAAAAVTALQIAVGAAVAIISIGVMVWNNYNQTIAENNRLIAERAQKAKEESKTISELISKYNELKGAENQDEGTRTQIQGIQEQITNLVGRQAENLDLVNGKLDTELEKLKNIELQNAQNAKTTLESAYIVAQEQYDKGYWATGSPQNGFHDTGDIDKALGKLGILKTKYANYVTFFNGKNAEEILTILKEWETGFVSLGSEGATALGDLNKSIAFYEEKVQALKSAKDSFFENSAKLDILESLKSTSVNTQETFDAFISGIQTSTAYSADYKQYLVEYANSLFPQFSQAVEDASDSLDVYRKSLSSMKDVLSSVQNAYSALESAQKDIDAGRGLSAETISKLAAVTDDYMDYLIEENGQLTLNTVAWKNMADAKLKAEMTKITLESDSLRQEREVAENSIRAYEQAISDLMDQVARYGDNPSFREEIYKQEAAIGSEKARIEEINKTIEDNQALLSKYGIILGSLQSIDLSNVTNGLDAIKLATDGMAGVISAIDSYSNSMSTLVSVQEALANSFTITLAQAKEFAAVYPEILNGATVSADGQIVLNEAVANSFIEAKRAELDTAIDVEINKLKADRAVLEAKKAAAEAQLSLAKSVGDGEGKITKELAEYRINAGNIIAQALIEAGIDEANAFRLAAAAMSQNAEEFNRVAMEVCTDVDGNFNEAAYSAAQAIYKNMSQAKIDVASFAKQCQEAAKAMAGVASGTVAGSSGTLGGSGGGVGSGGASIKLTSGSFIGSDYVYTAKESGLDDFIAQTDLDITGYTKAIAQIDGQIAALEALKVLPLKSFNGGLGGSDKGGSGGGSAKEIEEYIATINKLYAAEERLKDIQEKRAFNEAKIDTSGDTVKQLEYMREIIDLYDQEQDALHEINELRRQQISDNVAQLREYGFNVDWDAAANHLFISNLEHINDLQGSTAEETNELRKAYEDLIATTIGLNDANRDNSQTWWELQKSILDTREAIYSQWLDTKKYDVSSLERNDADAQDIVRSWRVILDGINAEIKYWSDLGYDYASEKIKALTQDLWDTQDAIKETLDSIVTAANDSLDNVQNVYDVLKKAAQEFAESDNKYISVDTLQQIMDLGVEYLAYLRDENGLLSINEESIQKVISSRTEQLAVESALQYIRAIEAAMAPGKEQELQRLLYATDAVTNSTWGLVYASLELLGLEDSQYRAAIVRIDTLRSLTDTAIQSIGKISGSLTDSLKKTENSLENLLKYVIEMIKWEVSQQVQGLKNQITQYRSIVDLQKESLRLAKEKDSYEKSVAKKNEAMSKLVSKIAQLSLDDSREANAEKEKLIQQLAELNEKLADEQADYAYNATVENLDKMADEYENEKNHEIKVLEDSISSQEKLYRLAIDRISNHWNTLYQDIIRFNYEAGSTIESEISSAWDTASLAVQRYGSYLDAVMQTQSQLGMLSNSMGSGDYSSSSAVGNSSGDYQTDTKATRAAEVDRLMAKLREMGAQWHSAGQSGNTAKQQELAAAGYQVGKEIGYWLDRLVDRGSDGVWYLDRIGGEKMFEVYDKGGANALFKYHTGGIAGDVSDPKDDEVFALLKKGEPVFTEQQKEAAYGYIDLGAKFAETYGDINDVLAALKASSPSLPIAVMNTLGKDSSMEVARSIGNADSNCGTNIERIEVDVEAPIFVTEKLTDDDIKEHSRTIVDIAAGAIEEGFSRSGVRKLSFAKP